MDARTFDRSKLPSRHAAARPSGGGYRREDRLSVTGRTIKQNLENVKFNANQKVACTAAPTISAVGGVVGLQGLLAPGGASVKVAGMAKLQFCGRTRALDRANYGFTALDGDISIDADKGALGSEVANSHRSDVLRKFADRVGPAGRARLPASGAKRK
jgi:Dehydratase family